MPDKIKKSNLKSSHRSEMIDENTLLNRYVEVRYPVGVVYVALFKGIGNVHVEQEILARRELESGDYHNEYNFDHYELRDGKERRGLISRLSKRLESDMSPVSALFVDGKLIRYHFPPEH